MSESPRRVYFVAIAGTGMGSLAGLLRARGLEVAGSGSRLYPPMSTALKNITALDFMKFASRDTLMTGGLTGLRA